MPTWSLEWIFFPCLFPACLSPDGHQISLLSHGTVVWGKEAHFKKLLVKKEKFDFSLPSLFFPRGAACCSCLCYPQEGTFLKANWNSAQTQSRPKDLVDSLDFTEGRFWQQIDFGWKQIPHQGSGILWNLVFIHEKYRCFGRWKGNLKWNYSFELFPEWKNSQRVKTERNKKNCLWDFCLKKNFACFKWENPYSCTGTHSLSYLGDFCVSFPPSLEAFSSPNDSGILGFSPLCVLLPSAKHLEPELVPLHVPCPPGSSAPSHAGFEDHLICERGFSF